MCRPQATYETLLALEVADAALPKEAAEQVQVEVKYQGYIDKQRKQVERIRRLEERQIPGEFSYETVTGLRTEAREKLRRFQPATLGQASRIMGVTPADMSILLVHLERFEKAAVG